MSEDILYIFATCLLRAFFPLFWGIFLLFYKRNFWQNIGICGVFIPIGILYLFDSFARLPSLAPVDIYDVRSYLVFICLPPFARFYANYALNIKIGKLTHLLHFIPFAVMLSLYLVLRKFFPHIPFCYDINEMLGYASEYPLYVVYYLMLPAIFTTQVCTYCYQTTTLLLQVRKLYKKHGYPVKYINQFFVVVFSFCAYPFVCMFFFSYYNNMSVLVAHNFSLPVFITVISILCMNKILPMKTKFAQYEITCQTSVTSDDHKNGLNPVDLKERIHVFFSTKKVYSNADLTIEDVAEHLNINRSYLSAFINKEFSCNFRKLLNTYRMVAAQKLLLDRNFEIKDVAYAVGYSSRTTFYKAFKEYVSSELSPAEWREARLNEL